jgi:uncharacterized protein YbjQ (UPF0145 family)
MELAMTHKKISGLSGNEIFCLGKIGARAGQLCVGNSVLALGVARGIGAGLSTLAGGEVMEVTKVIHDGRAKSFERMMTEAKRYGGIGVTGVTFDIVNHGGNIEFITTASTVHADDEGADEHLQTPLHFSTSADAQALYCQVDAKFKPVHFVFGNCAYSIGMGGSVVGALRGLARGEVTEYSEIFNQTRHLALKRLVDAAHAFGANAVIGIETSISPIMGTQEMMMVGTAATHPLLGAYTKEPVTSDMTNEEMWNMVNMGYLPIRLVMGVSVYSLGFKSGVISALQTLGGGEVTGLTEILYEAREKALARIEAEAERYGADEVVGVKTRIYDLGGGLIEFMAIGTAVKKIDGATTKTEHLIPQAVMTDYDTLVDTTVGAMTVSAGRGDTRTSARGLQSGPARIFAFIIFLVIFLMQFFLAGHKNH